MESGKVTVAFGVDKADQARTALGDMAAPATASAATSARG
jgi:hypothetical protein